MSSQGPSLTLTLWIHEKPLCDEAWLNYELFPPGTCKPGDLVEVRPVKTPGSNGFSTDATGDLANVGSSAVSEILESDLEAEETGGNRTGQTARSRFGGGTINSSHNSESAQSFLFVVRQMDPELKQKQSNMQISLASSIASLFGFQSRSSVIVTVVQKELYEASHVEITFRDQYIAGSDMWRLATNMLCDKCVYKGKKILFVGSIKAQIRQIYVRGQKVQAGYFSPRTKPIFRSESARFVIFIQMSQEMWHFDSEGSGEIVFNKLINGFLPELFKRWRKMNARHTVSIVLFTRVEYERGFARGILDEELDGQERTFKDFFRVVVSNMPCTDWTIILHQLKRGFSMFLRDILVQPVPPAIEQAAETVSPVSPTATSSSYSKPRPSHIIAGRPSPAIHGNILEAISLASSQFARDYIDRDLVRTGVSIVVITPGTGYFEVDYESLRVTTENLIGNGFGIDLVCLAKMPLHSVPLFKYKNPVVSSSIVAKNSMVDAISERMEEISSPPPSAGPYATSLPRQVGMSPPKNFNQIQSTPEDGWIYAVPHWIDISFWSSTQHQYKRKPRNCHIEPPDRQFIARCKMYELQMMGIMENEVCSISIPLLRDSPFYMPPVQRKGSHMILPGAPSDEEAQFAWMDEYDDMAFRPLNELKEGMEKVKRAWRKEEQRYERDRYLQRSQGVERDRAGGTKSTDTRGKEYRSSILSQRQTIHNPPPLPPPNAPVTPPVTPPVTTPLTTHLATPSSLSFPAAGPAAPKTQLSALSRPVRLARQLSFGFRGFGSTPKAAASTQITNAGSLITKGFNTDGEIAQERPKTPTTAQPLSPPSKTPLRMILNSRDGDSSDSTPEKQQTSVAPSRPISIKSNITAATSALERSKAPRRPSIADLFDVTKDRNQIDILKAASISRSAAPRIDPTDARCAAPASLSPTSALAPWFSLLNPSNPKKSDLNLRNQYRRWQHVFPRPLRTASVKWKSLCAPAALPLTTEHFPTAEQLRNEYQENPYVITQNDDDEDLIRNREELVREMISQRLQQGFQIVVGTSVAEATANQGGDNNVFDPNYMTKAGSSVFMSMGSQIHQLICDLEYNVEVKRYVRKPTTAISTSSGRNSFGKSRYTAYIRTVLCNEYIRKPIDLNVNHAEYNWNYVDQFIGGYEDSFTEQLRFFRARFVLIPTDPPLSARRGAGHSFPGGPNFAEDNDEEIRIEGITKLTQLFQRHKYIPPEDRNFEKLAKNRKKDLNPLEILYKTADPSVVVAQQLEALSLSTELDSATRRSQLFVGSEMFERNNLNLKALAQEMQGPRGLKLQDRRWHWRIHQLCFIGSEFVTWMTENFKDLETRQEAVELGNELMKSGLFHHVEGRHGFRDGNFFYQISGDYSINRPSSKGGLFGTRRSADKNVYTGSVGDHAPSPVTSRSRSSTIIRDDSSDGSGAKTPTPVLLRRKIALSKCMKYDVDPGKKSYRPEIINLHYDRLHNPDNCYHIRIDWMNVTAKLVEDAVSNWAKTVDRYGLVLVEAPIDELSAIQLSNPFRAPAVVKLCVQPPPFTSFPANVDMSLGFAGLSQRSDPLYYHKQIIKQFNFVLDTESARNFPPYAEVVYSWGKPTYKYSQYIHKSGVVFAQINDEGEFLLLANRLYTQRVGSVRENQKFERGRLAREEDHLDRMPSGYSTGVGYGMNASGSVMGLHSFPPSSFFLATTGPGSAGNPYVTPEMVKDELERFCADEEALKRFFEEVQSRIMSPTTQGQAFLNEKPNLDQPLINYQASNFSLSTSSLGSGFGIQGTKEGTSQPPTITGLQGGGNSVRGPSSEHNHSERLPNVYTSNPNPLSSINAAPPSIYSSLPPTPKSGPYYFGNSGTGSSTIGTTLANALAFGTGMGMMANRESGYGSASHPMNQRGIVSSGVSTASGKSSIMGFGSGEREGSGSNTPGGMVAWGISVKDVPQIVPDFGDIGGKDETQMLPGK